MVEETRTYVRRVRPGDVIKSPQFENLLYRDILELSALDGFTVNPMISSAADWMGSRNELLENPGLIKKPTKGIAKAGNMISYKEKCDFTREFVVIHIERDTDCVKEYWEGSESVTGEYPLTVRAKMLDPNGDYDENGIEIIFHMQSQLAKHTVNEVETCGFMNITYKRIF